MPYIRPEVRLDYDSLISEIIKKLPDDDNRFGHLNYIVTKLLKNENGNYDYFNSAIGVLECAKLELYRRQVAPYEEKAKNRNGDVY